MIIENNSKALPEKWITCKLKDVGEIIAGGTPSTNEPSFWGDEISWITPADLSGYKSMFISKGRKSISIKGLQSSSARLIPKGGVLFSSRAPIGYVVIASNELATNQGFKNIVPYSGIDSKYLYYYLLANKQLAEENASGTTFKEISATKFAELPLVLAPANEQVRISDKLDELLSELEKGKEQLQASLEQLKVYRQSILKHAFEGKLSEEWRSKQKKLKTPDELVSEIKAYRQEQYEKQLKEYKAGKINVKPKEPKEIALPTKSELADKPELPDGWTYLALTEIIENESTKISPSKDSKLKFVGMDCIEPHSLRPFKYHDFADFKSAGNFFEKDRVLYGRMRPYLNKVWRTEFAGACSGEFLVLNPTPVLNPDFLKYKLHSSEFVTFAMSNISGDRPRIAYDEVVSYIFPVCSIEEQVKIIHEVERLFSLNDEMEKTIEENLMKSDALKQRLLQKAFEGKLVEQNPKDEPASILLERIKKEREEYLKAEKERKKTEKPLHIKSRKMAEELKRIIEILKESKEPVSAKTLWQSSTHKHDIDDFYAALKKHIEAGEIIELPRKGKESFLKLADAK